MSHGWAFIVVNAYMTVLYFFARLCFTFLLSKRIFNNNENRLTNRTEIEPKQ